MSRIAVLTPWAPPADGIARHSAHLVEAFKKAGHEVLVITQRAEASRRPTQQGTTEVRSLLGVIPTGRAFNEVKTFGADMLFVQFAISAASSSLFSVLNLCRRAHGSGMKVVVGFHESAREFNLLGPVSRGIYRAIARYTSTAVAFSAAGEKALLDCGLFAGVVRVPLGTHPIEQARPLAANSVRTRYELEIPTVLCAGFTHPDKGTDLVLQVAEKVTQDLDGKVRFLIAGQPRQRRGLFRLMGQADEKFQIRLEQMAKESHGVNFLFCRYIPDEDIHEVMRQAAVVVLPYRSITQSGIANLALSSGAAIVASDIQGLAGELEDAAAYFSVDDTAGLAETLVSVLSDGVLSAQLRVLAIEKAGEQSYERVAELIIATALAPANGVR